MSDLLSVLYLKDDIRRAEREAREDFRQRVAPLMVPDHVAARWWKTTEGEPTNEE